MGWIHGVGIGGCGYCGGDEGGGGGWGTFVCVCVRECVTGIGKIAWRQMVNNRHLMEYCESGVINSVCCSFLHCLLDSPPPLHHPLCHLFDKASQCFQDLGDCSFSAFTYHIPTFSVLSSPPLSSFCVCFGPSSHTHPHKLMKGCLALLSLIPISALSKLLTPPSLKLI